MTRTGKRLNVESEFLPSREVWSQLAAAILLSFMALALVMVARFTSFDPLRGPSFHLEWGVLFGFLSELGREIEPHVAWFFGLVAAAYLGVYVLVVGNQLSSDEESDWQKGSLSTVVALLYAAVLMVSALVTLSSLYGSYDDAGEWDRGAQRWGALIPLAAANLLFLTLSMNVGKHFVFSRERRIRTQENIVTGAKRKHVRLETTFPSIATGEFSHRDRARGILSLILLVMGLALFDGWQLEFKSAGATLWLVMVVAFFGSLFIALAVESRPNIVRPRTGWDSRGHRFSAVAERVMLHAMVLSIFLACALFLAVSGASVWAWGATIFVVCSFYVDVFAVRRLGRAATLGWMALSREHSRQSRRIDDALAELEKLRPRTSDDESIAILAYLRNRDDGSLK